MLHLLEYSGVQATPEPFNVECLDSSLQEIENRYCTTIEAAQRVSVWLVSDEMPLWETVEAHEDRRVDQNRDNSKKTQRKIISLLLNEVFVQRIHICIQHLEDRRRRPLVFCALRIVSANLDSKNKNEPVREMSERTTARRM
jgi:predicted ATP-dependent protease